jgi:hypothetical protein
MVAGTKSQFRRDQRPAEVFVVLKHSDRDCRGRVIRLKTVAGEQSGLDVVKLVIVFAPVGSTVKPITAMALEIGNPS